MNSKDGKETVIAKSSKTLRIEGNHYFPPDSVDQELLSNSETYTTCYWEGEASHKSIEVDGQKWVDDAWYYHRPVEGSIEKVGHDFTNYYAFWRGVLGS
jgi:uncharacterized protein (DUF427 family)